MGGFLALSRGIDRVNTVIGKGVSWLILVAVIISAGNALIRKTLNVSSNAWLELQWYLYGAAFMGAAAYTLMQNEHIRIDIVFSRWSRRAQHWIELVGHLFFLMPFLVVSLFYVFPWFMRSVNSCGLHFPDLGTGAGWIDALTKLPDLASGAVWARAFSGQCESSMNAGGLILWPAKGILLLGLVLLFVQAISEIIKKVAVMTGQLPDSGYIDPHAPLELDEALLAEAGFVDPAAVQSTPATGRVADDAGATTSGGAPGAKTDREETRT